MGIFGVSLAVYGIAIADCPIYTGALPAPVPTVQTNDVTNRTLVATSATDPQNMNAFSFAQGENIASSFPPPGTTLNPCPTPTFTTAFQRQVNPGPDKFALVMIAGTQDTYNDMISNGFLRMVGNNMSLGATISVSATPPAGYSSNITPASIPSGMIGGYFLLRVPTGSATSESFTYRSKRNGSISYTVQYEVTGNSGASKVVSKSNTTVFRPRLSFVTPTLSVAANTCSPPLTVQTINGYGNATDVFSGSGNIAKILLSGAPADMFLDPACVYPTTSMSIQNPVPSPPAPGTRPASAISSRLVTFYFKGKQAQSFPVSAIYADTDGAQIFSVSETQKINALPPVAMELTGPAAVNQGACSTAFKLKLIDSYGNEAPVQGSTKSLRITGSGGTSFYSDAGCASSVGNTLSLSVGVSQATFYLRDNTAEALKVSIADPAPLGSAIQGTSYSLHVLSMGTVAVTSDPAKASTLAARLYQRLVGLPPAADDPNLAKMSSLILQGRILEAAHIATSLDGFFNITVKNVATPLSNRLYNPLEKLNDFVATWIGIVRDDRDARELLTGNHIYVGSALKTSNDQSCADPTVYSRNDHYDQLANSFTNLRTSLVPVRQCAYNTGDFSVNSPVLLNDAAGLLTTRTWAMNHLYAGTNRRAIDFALQVFMCKGIRDVADTSMPDWHIRRDVDRAPGGDPKIYNASCRGCHGGMDAMGGAFAFFDSYDNDQDPNDFRLFYINKGGYGPDLVMSKMNKNGDVFPPGWVTGDDSWNNFFTANQNQALGWSSDYPLKGNGAAALGQMFANSQAFPACMAKRAFRSACKRDPDAAEASLVNDLSQDFQASGYNMRRLFEKAASLSVCIGNGDQ